MIKIGENIEIINNLPRNDMVSRSLRSWQIYKITSQTGRLYIGKTKDIKTRIRAYRNNCCEGQTILLNSLNKYGFANHKVEVIEELYGTNEYCNEREIFWINFYMSNYSKNPEKRGMNLTDGGEGTMGKVTSEEQKQWLRDKLKNGWNPIFTFSGRKHSEDAKRRMSEKRKNNPIVWVFSDKAKEKISLSLKGRVISLETRIKLSLVLKGGKKVKWTQERKDKMRAIKLGTKHTEQAKKKMSLAQQNQQGKCVLQYTLEGEFVNEYISLHSAARALGISAACIHRVVHGKREKTKGFIFKYKL